MQTLDELEATVTPRPWRHPVWNWLIRMSWIIAMTLLVGALLGAALQRSAKPLYEARALVVVSDARLPTASVGDLAQAAFGTDTVLQPVIQQLHLNATSQSLLKHHQLEARAVSLTGAMVIIGRASEPALARDMANLAAQSFVAAAQEKGLGTFVQFGSGNSPAPAGSTLSRSAGLAGGFGALLGIAFLVGVFVTRHPVLSREDAEALFTADASFDVEAQSRLLFPRKQVSVRNIRPGGLVPAVWRAIGAGAEPPVVVVVRAGRGRRNRAALALLDALVAEGEVTALNSTQEALALALSATRTVIALVPSGAPAKAISDLDEEVAVAPWPLRRILLFLR